MGSNFKDTEETLELIRKAQEGDSKAENTLVLQYESYVDYMVSKYSKRTEIKDDGDLRSYINKGLLEGIRKFDPNKNTLFIYFAHIWMKKNIFLGEASYRFIRVPVNQKVFYDNYAKKMKAAGEDVFDIHDPEFKRFQSIEDTSTSMFTDLQQYNEELSEYEFPEKILFHKNSEEFSKHEESDSIDILKLNINSVLSEFNEKEVYIMEHLFGLNSSEKMSSEQIAKNLGVTKVNITFTKNRVIRLMRHTVMSNKLLNGI